MAYSSSSSPSSQFGLFPLFAISVGFLLMASIGSVEALECYYEKAHPSAEGRAIGEWNELGHPANKTIHCHPGFPHCITLHCQKLYGDKTLKTCGRFPGGTTTAKAACNYWRQDKVCGHDAKFYCRYCDTDKCNTDA